MHGDGSLISVRVECDGSVALNWYVFEVAGETFFQLFQELAEVSRGENPSGNRPIQFVKAIPRKDIDGEVSVRCYLTSERDGHRVEVSGGLSIASCSKEFGRFLTYVVTSSSTESRADRRTANAFSVLMAGQAAQTRALQDGQLPKHKDVAHQQRGDWLLYNRLVDLLAEKRLGYIGGTVQSSGKQFLDGLTSVLFQVLVPERMERMRLRNVHIPQLFADLLSKDPGTVFNKPEAHGHTKLPHLAVQEVPQLSDQLYSLLLLPWLQASRWKEIHAATSALAGGLRKYASYLESTTARINVMHTQLEPARTPTDGTSTHVCRACQE